MQGHTHNKLIFANTFYMFSVDRKCEQMCCCNQMCVAKYKYEVRHLFKMYNYICLEK